MLGLVRYHIVLVAIAATLVFSWVSTGEHAFALAGVVAVDWFFINVDEDRRTGIPLVPIPCGLRRFKEIYFPTTS